MPKARRDLSQTMLAKKMRDTSDTADYRLITTFQGGRVRIPELKH